MNTQQHCAFSTSPTQNIDKNRNSQNSQMTTGEQWQMSLRNKIKSNGKVERKIFAPNKNNWDKVNFFPCKKKPKAHTNTCARKFHNPQNTDSTRAALHIYRYCRMGDMAMEGAKSEKVRLEICSNNNTVKVADITALASFDLRNFGQFQKYAPSLHSIPSHHSSDKREWSGAVAKGTKT